MERCGKAAWGTSACFPRPSPPPDIFVFRTISHRIRAITGNHPSADFHVFQNAKASVTWQQPLENQALPTGENPDSTELSGNDIDQLTEHYCSPENEDPNFKPSPARRLRHRITKSSAPLWVCISHWVPLRCTRGHVRDALPGLKIRAVHSLIARDVEKGRKWPFPIPCLLAQPQTAVSWGIALRGAGGDVNAGPLAIGEVEAIDGEDSGCLH